MPIAFREQSEYKPPFLVHFCNKHTFPSTSIVLHRELYILQAYTHTLTETFTLVRMNKNNIYFIYILLAQLESGISAEMGTERDLKENRHS